MPRSGWPSTPVGSGSPRPLPRRWSRTARTGSGRRWSATNTASRSGSVYSSADSLGAAIDERRGIYWSRSRGELWRKGETSGATQELLRVDADCDRDALRFTVRQAGSGFCHRETRSCWGPDRGLGALERRLLDRIANPVADSYTDRLVRDPALLAAKLAEEAGELAEAATDAEIAWEAADVLYFTLTTLAARGVTLDAATRELDRRALKVKRRDGSTTVNRKEKT